MVTTSNYEVVQETMNLLPISLLAGRIQDKLRYYRDVITPEKMQEVVRNMLHSFVAEQNKAFGTSFEVTGGGSHFAIVDKDGRHILIRYQNNYV